MTELNIALKSIKTIYKKCSVIEIAKYTKTKIEDFISEANKVYNNKYDYSKPIYVNSKTKYIVTKL